MSRSIHTTRRDREKAHRAVYRDEAKKSEDIRLIDQSLDRKRLTKESVRDVRRMSPAPFTPVDVDAIKISTIDESQYVHYPAGVKDLTGVMRRLPPGILNGIASIALSLGAEVQEEAARVGKKGEAPDPWTGRLGYEGLPGVFNGRILGQRDSEAHIMLYAYVYDPENPGLRNWMILLRWWSLATFVHELAHHFDHTQRVARGRWLAEGERKVEGFAEGIEYEWTQKYVVPYLEETYPDEVGTTRRWIADHGGVMLPLSALAADPRVTENGIVGVFNIRRTIEELVSDIAKGTTLTETRLNFARELHYAEIYEPALKVITDLLEAEPGNLEALTLRADIFVHQRRFEDAVAIARAVVAKSPSSLAAWKVSADANEGLEKWDQVIEAATLIINVCAESDFDRLSAIGDRAAAFACAGLKAEAEKDIRTLEASGPFWIKRANRLRERLARQEKRGWAERGRRRSGALIFREEKG